jgi:MFS family permease
MFLALVTVGARNAIGVFVIPMSEEFGWSRTTISVAGAMGVLVNGLTQPFLGMLFDRHGKKVILAGLAAVGLTTIALSLTFHIIFLVFMFGIVASTALSGASTVNTWALLSRWFRRRRATVLGLNASGTSFGAIILVPFASYFMAATGSWRATWAVLGLIVLWGLPFAWMFLHDNPAKKGLQPDGDPEPPQPDALGSAGRLSGPLDTDRWTQPFRSPPFWQMSGSYIVCGATTFVLAFHFVAFAQEDRGISTGLAATIFALMGGLNVVGSIGAGILSDHFTRKDLLAITYFTRGMAYLILLLPPLIDIPVLSGELGVWLFAAVAGISWVATAPLTSTLTADVYGLRALGAISGICFTFHQIGGFGSVLLAGYLKDLTGSYTIPFLVVGSLLFPAAVSAFSINERKYSARYAAQTAPAAAGND